MVDVIGYPRDTRGTPGWSQSFPCGHSIRTTETEGKDAHQDAIDAHRDQCSECQLYMTKDAPNRGPDQDRGGKQ